MSKALLSLFMLSLASCQDQISITDLTAANNIVNSLSTGTQTTAIDTSITNLGTADLATNGASTDLGGLVTTSSTSSSSSDSSGSSNTSTSSSGQDGTIQVVSTGGLNINTMDVPVIQTT